jgi:hypothetical protein
MATRSKPLIWLAGHAPLARGTGVVALTDVNATVRPSG